MLRIQPLRVQRDEAIYECTATNSLGEINTSAKLSVLEGMCQRGTRCAGRKDRGMGKASQPWPCHRPVCIWYKGGLITLALAKVSGGRESPLYPACAEGR